MRDRDLKRYNASLMLSVVATALWSGTLAVVLSDIIGSYGLRGAQEGLMSSMISIGALAALLATVLFQGKYKKAQVIIRCGLLACGALLAKAIPMPFALFLLACFIMGLGHGAVDTCQSAFLADLHRGDTARPMGALHGIFGIGGVATPLLLQALLRRFSWRAIYVIVGLVCLALIAQFAAVTYALRTKVNVSGRVEPRLTLADVKKLLGDRCYISLVLTIFFGAAGQSGIIVWTIRYVSVSLNSPDIAALCLSIFWVASTVSRFGSPRLPLRPGLILAAGAFISAAAWAAALLVNQPPALLAACGVAGLASGSCIPLSLSEGASLNPESTGFSTSVLMISKTLAQILCPVAVAFVMSVYGMRAGMYVTALLFVANGIFASLIVCGK